MSHETRRWLRLLQGVKSPQVALLLVVVALSWAALRACETRAPGTLEEARANRRSDVWIETSGRVIRLLPDDTRGTRHQRILLDVGGRETLLVVHNIDVAARVPAERDDEVEVRGKYVWNEKGGLVHWTHHDASGRRPGGWVRHAGRTYR